MSIQEIATNCLVPPSTMLRPVREDSIEYLEMLNSLRANGLINSIAVRIHPTRRGLFEIIDGMWRYTCCKALGWDDIPCIVKSNVSDEKMLTLQIAANAVTFATRPIEFAHQMQRLLRLRESAGAPMTLLQLGNEVDKSVSWVSSHLKLLKLETELQQLITDGKMNLTKGIALARINKHKHQLTLWQEHGSKTSREFELAVGSFLQKVSNDLFEIRDGIKKQTLMRPRLQTMDSMLIELDRLDEISQIIVSKGLTTAYEGAKIALEWVLNLHDQGRENLVREERFKLTDNERIEIIGRKRYEELKTMREMRKERNEYKREKFD